MPFSQFSTKKLIGNREDFHYSGCTTDSGGGGTGDSMYQCMRNLGLCAPKEEYLVGYCTLHTLQLTLSNALKKTIGEGGLGNKNAVQLLHSVYDLQESMEWGLWKMYWRKASEELGITNTEETLKKMPAPIVTRWHTIGNGANFLCENMAICHRVIQIIDNSFTGIGSSLTKANTIVNGLSKLIKMDIIISDVHLINCFHSLFISPNLVWMQRGDEKIGGTPGFLSRHMFTRYFLMRETLRSLQSDGWREVDGMKGFRDHLQTDAMGTLIHNPSDNSRMVSKRSIQERKANNFFDAAIDSLEKHYDRYCKEFFFFTLYDESYATHRAAKFLSGEDLNSPPESTVLSTVHNCEINLNKFEEFIKTKVSRAEQLQNPHIKKCEGVFDFLIGEWYFPCSRLKNISKILIHSLIK